MTKIIKDGKVKNMNISELARQLKTEPQILREKLPELGFAIGERAIQIDDAQVERMKSAWAMHQKREKLKAKMAAQQEKQKKREETTETTTAVVLPPTITVADFAKKINIDVSRVIVKLMQEGVMAAMNQKIDYETAHIVAEDFNIQTSRGNADAIEEDTGNSIKDIIKKEANLVPRPPVVVVMGHVDHGKTTLLDTIRKTKIADTESGAITQHMGAYQAMIEHPVDKKKQLITFIDTPGHEAFRGMRSRGGKVADIAVLVIAADDKIQPQTLESVSIIQKEGLSMIVAINKVDKPDADIDRIKTQLSEINLSPEDWGGDTICIPISAKSNTNIDALLEHILLVADIEELKANPDGVLYGTIIESRIDKGLGPVATAIIQNGTLKTGDMIMCGHAGGKVKSLQDYLGKSIEQAVPSQPVRILGLKPVPQVGELIKQVENYKEIKKLQKRSTLQAKGSKDEDSAHARKKTPAHILKIFLKTDVLGTLEALLDEIDKIRHSEAEIQIIRKGIGSFTESDILEAEAHGARLIGFKVKTAAGSEHLVTGRGIVYQSFSIIYELLDYLKAELEKLIPPEVIEEAIGEAKVLAFFGKSQKHMILGGVVTDGIIRRDAHFHIFRNGEVLGEGKIFDLQVNREAVKEARPPHEFGLKFSGDLIAKEGDILKFFTVRQEKRILS